MLIMLTLRLVNDESRSAVERRSNYNLSRQPSSSSLNDVAVIESLKISPYCPRQPKYSYLVSKNKPEYFGRQEDYNDYLMPAEAPTFEPSFSTPTTARPTSTAVSAAPPPAVPAPALESQSRSRAHQHDYTEPRSYGSIATGVGASAKPTSYVDSYLAKDTPLVDPLPSRLSAARSNVGLSSTAANNAAIAGTAAAIIANARAPSASKSSSYAVQKSKSYSNFDRVKHDPYTSYKVRRALKFDSFCVSLNKTLSL